MHMTPMFVLLIDSSQKGEIIINNGYAKKTCLALSIICLALQTGLKAHAFHNSQGVIHCNIYPSFTIFPTVFTSKLFSQQTQERALF